MDTSNWLPQIKMKTLSALSLIVLMSGCATTAQQANAPDKEEVVRIGSMTTIDAIREAETIYQQSQQRDLNFLAPQHFDMAEKAIEEAKVLLNNNQPREKIVSKVAVAETVLRNGEMMARKVKSTLKDELELKETLDSLNAPKLYSGEYGSLVQKLNEVIRKVEDGKKDEVETDRLSLRKNMLELEARSIRHNALSEPEEILKRVKYRGGEKLAPMTYNDALAVFKHAEEFIKKNPNNAEAVQALGNEALFAAKRALNIAEQAAALSHKVNVSLEQVVLDEEYRMYRISRAMGHDDIRDNPIETQSEIIAKSAEEVTAQFEKQEGLIVALRDTLIKVRDSANLMAVNSTVKQLKRDKGELLAKEALYAAKVAQLRTDVQNKDHALLDLQQQLQNARNTLAMMQPTPAPTTEPVIAENSPEKDTLPVQTEKTTGTQLESVSATSERINLVQQEIVASTIDPIDEVKIPEQAKQQEYVETLADQSIVERVEEVIEAAQQATAPQKPAPAELVHATSELITEVLAPIQEDINPSPEQTAALANPVQEDQEPVSPRIRETSRSLDDKDELSFELESLASDQ